MSLDNTLPKDQLKSDWYNWPAGQWIKRPFLKLELWFTADLVFQSLLLMAGRLVNRRDQPALLSHPEWILKVEALTDFMLVFDKSLTGICVCSILAALQPAVAANTTRSQQSQKRENRPQNTQKGICTSLKHYDKKDNFCVFSLSNLKTILIYETVKAMVARELNLANP